jgi:hypothetical protein
MAKHNNNHKTAKIALFVSGGIVQEIRSNIRPQLEVIIIDKDNEPKTADKQWEEFEKELPYKNI